MPASHESPIGPGAFEDLLARAREGERAAQDELCERFYPRVQRQVHNALARDIRSGRPWLSARFSTADIVQETFHGVIRDLDGFEGKSEAAFGAYLTMVVRNRILDAVRFHQAERRDGRRGAAELSEDLGAGRSVDPAEAAVRGDTERAYLEVLSALPEREQLLVRARFDGTATFEELTEALGYSSVTTTRREFTRARSRLALILEDRLGSSGGDDA